MLSRNFLTLVISFIATIAHADDKSAELISYLEENAPRSFILYEESVEFRDFPNGDRGRLSVIGEYVSVVPVVQPDEGFSFLQSELRNQGYSRAEIGDALRATRFVNAMGQRNIVELTIVQEAGISLPFSAELPYIETVSGISLSGRVQTEQFQGRLLNSISGEYYIVGTASFDMRVNQIVNAIANLREEKIAQEAAALREAEQQALREAAEEAAAEAAMAARIQATGNPCAGRWEGQDGCISITFGANEKYDRSAEIGSCLLHDPDDGAERIHLGGNQYRYIPRRAGVTVRFFDLPVGESFQGVTCG